MTDSTGPGKLVCHMQNLSYTYNEYLICIGLGPSISSVICKNPSYSGLSYPSSPVYIYIYIYYIYPVQAVTLFCTKRYKYCDALCATSKFLRILQDRFHESIDKLIYPYEHLLNMLTTSRFDAGHRISITSCWNAIDNPYPASNDDWNYIHPSGML